MAVFASHLDIQLATSIILFDATTGRMHSKPLLPDLCTEPLKTWGRGCNKLPADIAFLSYCSNVQEPVAAASDTTHHCVC